MMFIQIVHGFIIFYQNTARGKKEKFELTEHKRKIIRYNFYKPIGINQTFHILTIQLYK